MFQTDHEYLVDSIQRQLAHTNENYKVQKNDYLTLQVFTNGGERIIDPDFELSKQQTGTKSPNENNRYLVREDGQINFPLVGNVYVDGFSLYQIDSILSISFSKYYSNPYVVTKLLNKRVVVIGPTGGKVIPLDNENINLLEVIALYGGMDRTGKAYNIKLLRGNLKNPDVQIIDLSTIEGMKQANLDIQPQDVIYIETHRKVLGESLPQIATIFGLITNVLVTILVLSR
jgi:polysaccharide export outer membrane protein